MSGVELIFVDFIGFRTNLGGFLGIFNGTLAGELFILFSSSFSSAFLENHASRDFLAAAATSGLFRFFQILYWCELTGPENIR